MSNQKENLKKFSSAGGVPVTVPTRAPWYKEPLMWLVLGLPATVVVAGFVTLYIASSNPETLVNAPHTKVGFTVEKVVTKVVPELQVQQRPD